MVPSLAGCYKEKMGRIHALECKATWYDVQLKTQMYAPHIPNGIVISQFGKKKAEKGIVISHFTEGVNPDVV